MNIDVNPIIDEKIHINDFHIYNSTFTWILSIQVARNCKSGPMLRMPYCEGPNDSNHWLAQRLLRDVVLSSTSWTQRYEYWM